MKEHPIDKEGTSLKLAVEECAAKIKASQLTIKEDLAFGVMSSGIPLPEFCELVIKKLLASPK